MDNYLPVVSLSSGHSRTIVGIEDLRNGNTNLLLFDPGVPKARMEQFHGKINYNLLQTVRKTFNAFRAKQYQIVAVVGILDDREFEVGCVCDVCVCVVYICDVCVCCVCVCSVGVCLCACVQCACVSCVYIKCIILNLICC